MAAPLQLALGEHSYTVYLEVSKLTDLQLIYSYVLWVRLYSLNTQSGSVTAEQEALS